MTMCITRKSVVISLLALLSACSQRPFLMDGEQAYWDFDHQVQFKQRKLSQSSYHIEIIANKAASFERSAVFLLRRAQILCPSYGYSLQILDGVESYDHKRASPNLIMGNLKAKIDCDGS